MRFFLAITLTVTITITITHYRHLHQHCHNYHRHTNLVNSRTEDWWGTGTLLLIGCCCCCCRAVKYIQAFPTSIPKTQPFTPQKACTLHLYLSGRISDLAYPGPTTPILISKENRHKVVDFDFRYISSKFCWLATGIIAGIIKIEWSPVTRFLLRAKTQLKLSHLN